MERVLSFDHTPTLSVPLRFFLSAPLFAAAAALLLLWQGPEALASRWSPVTLALTHLMTLGVLASVMTGALLQILPVVFGASIPRPDVSASLIHVGLTLGTIALVTGFLLQQAIFFQIAIVLLLLALGGFAAIGLGALWRMPGKNDMLTTVRLSLASLAATVVLGSTAAAMFAWPQSEGRPLVPPLPMTDLTNLHASWGLLGWVGLLIAGIAYQVVPMFQVTPQYPSRFTRWFARVLFLLLVMWSLLVALAPERPLFIKLVLTEFLYGGYVAFALTTLYLLWQRKRPKPDPTTLFWRLALFNLLACIGCWIIGELLPQVSNAPAFPVVLGVLFIIGFAFTVINGMLYKIVPFLVWYHLQNSSQAGGVRAPNVKQVLPDNMALGQLCLHAAAFVLLLGAAVWPHALSRIAAIAFVCSCGWLWRNLLVAVGVYRKCKTDMAAQIKPA